MKILVTGAAGFIGSHLCERLLQNPQNEVLGIDVFLPSATPRWIRERNLQYLHHSPRFTFIEADLLQINWDTLLEGVDIIYHLAGVPGVRTSWGEDFKLYVTNNILVTQKLLEASVKYPIKKFIYTSTSSVYGQKDGKVAENDNPTPLSPYGVTKLSGEHLCRVFYQNDGFPITILRLFTVYGPRQRPDMAFHRFINKILLNEPIQIYGDGTQTRDFTYISDCVEAIAAVTSSNGVEGETINIGGKERASLLTCLTILEEAFGQNINVQFTGSTYGEPKHTWADITKAQTLLQYDPKITLRDGLRKEIVDIRDLYNI
ncbi:NAD-dependent epimerase/dehydratase family protein [Robertmurraya sp. FSL R5-0851]|uniref:NAD-dependent epimerase/dehydratase family protein n=1 Tax=Robertmurraya sp. FSL R5-0851 TaxID=2921584 RepID=UPI00136B170F